MKIYNALRLPLVDEKVAHKNFRDLERNPFLAVELDWLDSGNALWMSQVYQALLGGQPWKLDVPFNSKSDVCANLHYEAKRVQRCYGGHSLALGFPMVHFHDENNKICSAPLLLWQVDLIRSEGLDEVWTLSRQEHHRMKANAWLVEYLNERFEIGLNGRWSHLTNGQGLNRQQLYELCDHLSRSIPCTQMHSDTGFSAFDREMPVFENALVDSGVWLGVFPTQYGSLLRQLDTAPEPPTFNAEQTASLPLPQLLDPDQQKLMTFAQTSQLTTAFGHSGTGKTYLLWQQIVQNLALGKRTLVVSTQVDTLRELSGTAIDMSLGNLTLLMEDVQQDLPRWVEDMLQELKTNPKTPVFPTAEWELCLHKLKRLETQYQRSLAELHTPALEGKSWDSIVDKFLSADNAESKEVLSNLLQPSDFTFDDASWTKYRNDLRAIEPLFERVGTLNHPLAALHNQWFEKADVSEQHEAILLLLDQYINQCTTLHRHLLRQIDKYAHTLSEVYDLHVREMRHRIDHTLDQITDFEAVLGEPFSKYSRDKNVLQPLFDMFSASQQAVSNAAEEVAASYKHLQDTQQKNKYFDFKFLRGNERFNIAKLKENLVLLQESVQFWRQRLNKQLQEEVQRLSSKTQSSDAIFDQQTRRHEDEMEQLIQQINQSKLLAAPVDHKMLTLSYRQQYLSDLLERLRNIKAALGDFSAWHAFKYKTWQSGPQTTLLVQSLAKVRNSHWLDTFESWFLHHHLTSSYRVNFPETDKPLQDLKTLWTQYQTLLPSYLWSKWLDKRKISTQSWGKQSRKEKFTDTLYRDPAGFIAQDIDMFLDRYPVWFLTPHAALELLPKGETLFDWVLIDDAEQLSPWLAPWLLAKGHQAMVLGQSPNTNRNPKQHLSLNWNHLPQTAVMHRLRQEMLPDQLETAPALQNKEASLRTVEIEPNDASQLLSHLLKDLVADGKTAPRVAIVCAHPSDAVQIQRLLHVVEADKNNPLRPKLQQLQRSGLQVILLNELSYNSFDTVLLYFNRIENAQEGDLKQLLCMIVQRFWIYYTAAASNSVSFAGMFVRQAIELEREPDTNWIPLSQQVKPGVYARLVEMLSLYISPVRQRPSAQIGGSKYPLLIAPNQNEQPWHCILLNLCVDPELRGSLFWEAHRIQRIEKAGIRVIHSWSVNWWRDLSVEGRRIAGSILSTDNQKNIEKAPQREQINTPAALSDTELEELLNPALDPETSLLPIDQVLENDEQPEENKAVVG